MKKTSRRKPKTHQKIGAKFAVKNEYCLLAMDMGLGKSFTALLAWIKSGKGNLLIVCPASLVLNWKQEIFDCFGKRFMVSAFKEGKAIYKVWDTDIVIISYDLGQKSPYLFEWADYLILDEGHDLKSMSAKRTEFYHKEIYENSIPRVNILTGTPIQNRVKEYYSLMCLCYYNPKLKSDFLKKFPDDETFADYFSYRHEFTIYVKNRRVKQVKWKGYRKNRVKELKKYLKPIYFRKTFEEVFTDMPPIIFKDVLMSEAKDVELLEEYKRLSNLYDTDEEAAKMNSTRKAEAALEIAPFTVAYAKQLLDDGEKVVIFSDHIAAAERIAEKLGTVALTGEVLSSQRFKATKEFQEGKRELLVCTTGAMSTGHNMTAAWNLITNDEPWSPGKLGQVYGRVRRIGQQKQCVVHRMYGSPQAQKIAELLREKMQTIKAVT